MLTQSITAANYKTVSVVSFFKRKFASAKAFLEDLVSLRRNSMMKKKVLLEIICFTCHILYLIDSKFSIRHVLFCFRNVELYTSLPVFYSGRIEKQAY